MKTGYFASVVSAFFVVVSCATLASVLWFIRTELFPGVSAPVLSPGQSAEDRTERAASNSTADLRESHPETRSAPVPKQVVETVREAGVPVEPPSYEKSVSEPRQVARRETPPFGDLQVLFKIEQQRTIRKKPVIMWRPRVSRIDVAHQVTFEAKVLPGKMRRGGTVVELNPVWNVLDPDMVAVTLQPGSRNEASITVLHAGKSKLQVSSHGISKDLTIDAAYEARGMRVVISPQ